MKGKDREHDEYLFKQIASRYTEFEGSLLKEEVKNWKGYGESSTFVNMDREIYAYIRKRKRVQAYKRIYAAASIFLMIGFSLFFHRKDNKNLSEEQNSSDNSVSLAEQGDYEVIPLTAKLPSGFEIKDVKLDLEETIYFIENDKKDDVILVISREKELSRAGLKEITLKETNAYGLSRKDYHILTFQWEEYTYTLTCRYDMRTLFEISGSII